VSSVKEIDEDCWFDPETKPTLREVAKHSQRINQASLDIPIILNDDGSLMDGGQRLYKALLQGREFVMAVQFSAMLEPDEVSEVGE
jgi:hypothetical protein